MKNYDEIRSALLKLCENQGLRFIETELEDEKIEFIRKKEEVILNKNYRGYKN